jgi:hypothetical protein
MVINIGSSTISCTMAITIGSSAISCTTFYWQERAASSDANGHL